MTWIDVTERLPEAGVPVLAVLESPQPCVILAQWCPRLTLPAHPEAADGEYDEARDEYYAPEGWYQWYEVDGHLDDEPYWRCEYPVSHWQPTPPLPARRAQ